MTKISGSTATTFFKVVFPAIWFGVLALFLLMSGVLRAPPFFFLVPIVMAVYGVFLFRRFVWDLADEVYDAGDHLVFKTGRLEQRVSLEEIVNIDYLHMASPERVTIHVRSPGPLGKELVFTPPMRMRWFSKSPIVSDLIDRVDRARQAV